MNFVMQFAANRTELIAEVLRLVPVLEIKRIWAGPFEVSSVLSVVLFNFLVAGENPVGRSYLNSFKTCLTRLDCIRVDFGRALQYSTRLSRDLRTSQRLVDV